MSQRLLLNIDQLDIVRNIPLLANLTIAERDDFIKGGGVFSYLRKQTLFNAGDEIESIYILCSGIVQETRETIEGDEVTLNIYKPGDLFCKTELFLEEPSHLTSARAVDRVHIMELPVKRFKESLQKYDSVKNKLVSSLARLAVMKQLEVEQQTTMTATEMLAAFLRQICEAYGLDPYGFTLPYTKSLIASRLGMKLETLSRALPNLKYHGIHVRGSHVSFIGFQPPFENVIKLFPLPVNMRRWRGKEGLQAIG